MLSSWLFCRRTLLLVIFLLGLLLALSPTILMQQTAPPLFWSPPIFPVYVSPVLKALNHRPVAFTGVTIPAGIKFCLDSTAERIDLLGTVHQQNQTLYLLAAYRDFTHSNPLLPLATQDELIVLHHQAQRNWCERLMPQSGEAIRPLSAFVSPQVAFDLELQRYRHWLSQAGGATQFQRNLTRQMHESQGAYQLSDEQIQALHQLGIDFSEKYHRLTSTTFS